ncbi:MAG: hypothetical protein EOP09_12200 [Proteobacteria bacterium]|nr:MAG: hypothetical protein EOP09_12200 [Pseudomonadota bacterium]
MTLSMAWVRRVGVAHELVFASDSRLTGGRRWDACPKILTLPRSDALIAFAGDTLDAYPLMIQFRNWVELDSRARDRERDITEIKKRMRRMFADMHTHISDLPRGVDKAPPFDCELLFGGWSWLRSEFCIWRFAWNADDTSYNFSGMRSQLLKGQRWPIMFAGTPDAVEDARTRLADRLEIKNGPRAHILNMEPFEILRDVIRAETYSDVGGPPQLAKVYRNGRSQPFAVRWATPAAELSVLGRPLFHRERIAVPIVDPDAVEFRTEKTLAKRARRALVGVDKGVSAT